MVTCPLMIRTNHKTTIAVLTLDQLPSPDKLLDLLYISYRSVSSSYFPIIFPNFVTTSMKKLVLLNINRLYQFPSHGFTHYIPSPFDDYSNPRKDADQWFVTWTWWGFNINIKLPSWKYEFLSLGHDYIQFPIFLDKPPHIRPQNSRSFHCLYWLVKNGINSIDMIIPKRLWLYLDYWDPISSLVLHIPICLIVKDPLNPPPNDGDVNPLTNKWTMSNRVYSHLDGWWSKSLIDHVHLRL